MKTINTPRIFNKVNTLCSEFVLLGLHIKLSTDLFKGQREVEEISR